MREILIVDDDADIRQLVAELLRLSGYECTTAPSGLDALRLLERGEVTPSLVLLDVQMPDLDGWETLRGIRSLGTGWDVPVILCTVKSSPTDTALGWTLGCDGYVVKPFAIADLVAEVQTVLALDESGRADRRTTALQAITEVIETS